MVNFARTALVAILATTASAEHHRLGRRHMHPRGYVQSPPPAEYSTVPEAGESSSKPYHTVPAPHPTTEGGEYPITSAHNTVPSGVSSSAPYSYGNTTVPIGTGTGVSTQPEIPESTVVVIPLPETTPVEGGDKPTGGNGYPTGEKPTGGNGKPTGELPTGGAPGTTPVASEGEVCGPATVTVTVTKSTVYVTSGKGKPSTPAAGPSSVPEAETSAKTYPSAPVESHPAPTYPVDTAKPETTPVASETESKPEYPTAPQVPEQPETTPVASETKSYPAPTPKPETSEVHSAPVASSSKVETKSAPKPKPTYTPSSGKKRGIIYQETSDLKSYDSESCGWAWNWNSNNFGQEKDWNYVPILNTPDKASEFTEQVKKALDAAPEGSKYVMGLNEPDQKGGGGSGVDVGTAVDNYLEHIAPLAKSGAKLGSISVTSDQNPADVKGLRYLEAWKKGCDAKGGCPVDFVCLHYYGNPDQSGKQQAEDFITYMKGAIEKVHELWDSSMPIWLTEVSALPFINEDTEGKNVDFIKDAVSYLEKEPAVERYAYFMASPGYMIDDGGNLTPAGEAYLQAS